MQMLTSRVLMSLFVLGAAGNCASPPAPAPAAASPAAAAPGTRVEVKVTDEGFVPSRIPAKKGVPITLVITRQAAKTCATEIRFDGDPGSTDLPVGKTVEVTFTPPRTGEIKFGCAMGMMIGGVLATVD
jgi:plastocyanin domain-containing protein